MSKDWVPMVGYGDFISVGPASTAYIVLYPVPAFSTTDEEFLFTDTELESLYLERIVGTIRADFDGGGFGTWAWCMMPLGVNYDTLSAQLPYSFDWTAGDSEWANEPFWDKRGPMETGQLDPTPVDHPYWHNVDNHPRRRFGSAHDRWPVLVVRNQEVVGGLRVQHQLRGLWYR